MSPLQIDYLVQKEKYQDMVRAAQQDRLLQDVKKLRNAGQPQLHRNLAAWLGLQMVKWGSKLHRYGSVSAAASTPAVQTEYLPN